MNVFASDKNIYSLIFALNALGLMICSTLNAKIVLKTSPEYILKKAFVAMSVFACILIGAGMIGDFILFEMALFATLSSLGFLLPNLTTLAMARFKAYSGTASAVLGTIQFTLAGIMSFLVGAFEANTPILLALAMAIAVWCGSGIYMSILFTNKK